MKEETEKFSDSELDDTDTEESPATNTEVNPTGSVPQESEESTENFSDSELDDTETEESPATNKEIDSADSVPQDLKENTEEFSGNELDDTNNEEVPTTNTEINSTGSVLQNLKGKNRFRLTCILLVFVLGISTIFLGRYFLGRKNNPEAVPATIPGVQLIKFDSFVIPYKGIKNYSYISLSASFYLQKEAVRLEIDEKKHLLRGAIYELISRQTQQPGWDPSLLKLKNLIRKAVNRELSSGQVDELFITHYLVI
jgi:flagellar basal body-associated protein FliL